MTHDPYADDFPWTVWFAWYPVKLLSGQWAWGRYVEWKRRPEYRADGCGAYTVTYIVYRNPIRRITAHRLVMRRQELSQETVTALDEIDDNRRRAAQIAGDLRA